MSRDTPAKNVNETAVPPPAQGRRARYSGGGGAAADRRSAHHRRRPTVTPGGTPQLPERKRRLHRLRGHGPDRTVSGTRRRRFVAALVAILGIRFTKIKAGGVEVDGTGYDAKTAGLPKAEPQPHNPPTETTETHAPTPERLPVTIDVIKGLGTQLGVVPVAVTRLTTPMREIDPAFLRDYQSALRESQKSYFLTHILGHPHQCQGDEWFRPLSGAARRRSR